MFADWLKNSPVKTAEYGCFVTENTVILSYHLHRNWICESILKEYQRNQVSEQNNKFLKQYYDTASYVWKVYPGFFILTSPAGVEGVVNSVGLVSLDFLFAHFVKKSIILRSQRPVRLSYR